MAKITNYYGIKFEGNVTRESYINYDEKKVGFLVKDEFTYIKVELNYEEATWLFNQLREDAKTLRERTIIEQEKAQVLISENDKFYVRRWNLHAPVYGPFNSIKEARDFRKGFDTTETLGAENYIIEVK